MSIGARDLFCTAFPGAFGHFAILRAVPFSTRALLAVQARLLADREQHPRADPFARYADDPLGFIEGPESVLGATVWDTPRSILRALAEPRARLAVRGCHRSSKTWALGQAVVWFVATGGDVITTAPNAPSVGNIWREIRAAYKVAKRRGYPLPGEMLTTEWKIGRDVVALGRSTDKAERFQGGNRPKLLVIVDEAPGLRTPIFEAIEGLRSGGDVRVVMLGNPTLLGGPFFEAFHAEREAWTTFTIDAFNTPNLAGHTEDSLKAMSQAEADGLPVPFPYLASPGWVREKLVGWGPTDPRYQSRVRGGFPTQSQTSVYPLAWLEAARDRELPATTGKLCAGIDPAGEGADELAVYLRRGPHVITWRATAAADAWERCQQLLVEHGGPGAFECVTVDADGIGYGLAKRLEEAGYPVTFAHALAQAQDRERFDRAKDEWHWLLRERFEEGLITGLRDEGVIAQLAQIQYRLGSMGRTVVESKADMRARGVKSPDRAEALMLAFAPAVTRGVRSYLV